MPRYFFDVHDGFDVIDGFGVALLDLSAAEAEALLLGASLVRESPHHLLGEGALRVDIRTRHQGVVSSLVLRASFESGSAPAEGAELNSLA